MTNEKVKAVLVGCGGITGAWMRAVNQFDDVEVVGLVDLNQENIATFKETHGVDVPEGTSVSEVVAATGADVVFDCTTPNAHVHVVTEALDSGCAVLGEKPLADTMANAKRMITKARETEKLYAVIQNRRYNQEIVKVRNAIRSGEVGDLTTLHADFFIGAHFTGFRVEMDHPLLLDMAIHLFDEARFISGKDPVAVQCHEWNPKGSWYKNGASAVATFHMEDDVIFTFRGSWCSEGLRTSWNGEWRVIGETGSLFWDGDECLKGEKTAGNLERPNDMVPIELPEGDVIAHLSHAGVMREFLDALRSGNKPQTVCDDNIKSLAMVHAAVQSAESGGERIPVTIP